MDNNQLNNLAVKIVKAAAEEAGPTDPAALARSIDRLGQRLDRLESTALQLNVLPFPVPSHPGSERFAIPEIPDAYSSGSLQEKICTFEPHRPPCDNCSMCTARGF